MNGITAIRTRLQLSQSEFAAYLGIPKSNLAMAETNKRALSSAVLLKMANLQKAMAGQNATGIKATVKAMDKKKQLALDRNDEHPDARVPECRARLKRMLKQYQALLEGLHTVEILLLHKAGGPADNGFWKSQEERILKKLRRCDNTKQEQLQRKIDVLENSPVALKTYAYKQSFFNNLKKQL